jgi:alpha-methylacyl-CoA racemase
MFLAFGVVCGILEASRSGQGQVVDAAMVDGAAMLMAPFYAASAIGFWNDERGTNLLDSGAPYYDVYRCADGGELALGAIEPQFYAALLDGLDLDPSTLPDQHDRSGWPALRTRFAEVIATRTRDDWVARFAGRDACVTPVLTMREAADHPHIVARRTLVDVDGVVQPAPAPRFSATRSDPPTVGSAPGADTDEALRDWGFSADEVAQLRAAGAIA